MDEPWVIFFEELQERGTEILEQEGGPEEELLTEAVQETFEATVDGLLNQLDWSEEEAGHITKRFASVVGGWAQGSLDWEELREELQTHQQEWEVLKEGF